MSADGGGSPAPGVGSTWRGGRRDREGVISPCMGHSRVHLLLWPKCWISSCLDILHTPMLSDFSSPLMSLAKRQAQSHSKLGGGADGRDTCNMLVSC